MENRNELKSRAYTIWEHYWQLQAKAVYKNPEMKKIVDDEEAYWREELLTLSEDDVPQLMQNAGLRPIDDDTMLRFHS